MSNVLWTAVFTLPPLIVSVVLHEVAHGWAAEKLGDPTARSMGRITFNPIKHIDPFLTLLLPGLLILGGSPVVFGGAKPVPVNPVYFKSPRRGMMWVALAGPVTNFILAGICAIILRIIVMTPLGEAGIVSNVLLNWSFQGIVINLVLGLFNLLPVPPLDGGRIAVGVLPIDLARAYARIEPYGLFIIFFLLYAKLIDPVLLPILSAALHFLLPNLGPSIPQGFD